MFKQVYKSSIKNLFRSLLFWATLALVFFIVIHGITQSSTGYLDSELGETIWDTDPRYVMDYKQHEQYIDNAIHRVTYYAIPIFVVVAAALIVMRDHEDDFFEIEHSGNVSPSTYFFGRFAAQLSVVLPTCIIGSFVSVYGYYFTRGGIPEFTLGYYLTTSLAQIMREIFAVALPMILMYIGIVFFAANVLHSGFAGGVAGMGLVLFDYIANRHLQRNISDVYFKYISPIAKNLYFYWRHSGKGQVFPGFSLTTPQAILSMAVKFAIGIALLIGAYICTRRREV